MTPGYAAPERFKTARGSPEADFYSLGVAAYEMLTGQMPFMAETVSDWAAAHYEQVQVPVREREPNTPPDLAEFIEAALTKDPVQRRIALQPCLQRWAEDTATLVVSHPPLPREQYDQTIADAPTVTH